MCNSKITPSVIVTLLTSSSIFVPNYTSPSDNMWGLGGATTKVFPKVYPLHVVHISLQLHFFHLITFSFLVQKYFLSREKTNHTKVGLAI